MIFVIVAVVLLGRFAVRHEWPGTSHARNWQRSHSDQITSFVRQSPATFIYLGVVAVTTWVVVGSDPRVSDALLADQSTNLHHLTHDPIHVLIRSAFWLTSYYQLALWVILFLVVLAPAERWLGTGRWLSAFIAGHVGATLVTASVIWVAIRTGAASHRLEDVVDVGVSYGFFAIAALFTFRLSGRWRWLWAIGLIVFASIGIALDASFTRYGHAAALTIGFALYPLTRSPGVIARSADPIFIPSPDRPAPRSREMDE